MSEDKPSFWTKVKAKTEGFVKNAISYIPRGIMFTAALYAGSGALGIAFPDLDFLGVGKNSLETTLTRGLLHVGIGSIISGAMGAYLYPVEDQGTTTNPANGINGSKKEFSNERARTQNIGDDFAISNTNHHLPNKPIELTR